MPMTLHEAALAAPQDMRERARAFIRDVLELDPDQYDLTTPALAEAFFALKSEGIAEGRAAQRREDAEAWCKLIIDGAVGICRVVALTGFTPVELLDANKRFLERAAAIEGGKP